MASQGDRFHSAGIVAYQKSEYKDAIRLISQAIANGSENAVYYNSLGSVLMASNQPGQAIKTYSKALQLDPNYAEAHYNLGNVLRDQGYVDAAIDKYRAAIRLKPDYVGALNNLGNALRFKGRFDEAVVNFERAIKINPNSAATFCNLGNCFKAKLDLVAAIGHYQQAIGLKPDFVEAHFNKSVIHLLAGEFQAGWTEYEWRLQRPDWKSTCRSLTALPRWNKESLVDKRILVISEQGFGDTLQFVRYLPFLKSRSAIVTLATQEQLFPLLHNFPGLDRLTPPTWNDKPEREHDFYVPLLSLPGIFNTTLPTIPNAAPYIFPDPIKTQCWQNKIADPDFKVGLVWAGRPTHANDHHRSIALAHFARLAQVQGIKLYGLQKGQTVQQSQAQSEKFGIINLGTQLNDFSDTAAVIANLDLVISVDTAVAHLAGAMGRPVWLLLPRVPDWRWLLKRTDSPWYPAMRIFRQRRHGDWQMVLQEISIELERLAATRASGPV